MKETEVLTGLDVLAIMNPYDFYDEFFRPKQHKYVMVDVDNTLYDFGTPLKGLLQEAGYNTGDWNTWNFYKNYMSDEKFYKFVDAVHKRQVEFEPFSYAFDLLDYLNSKYKVLIVSHRKPEFRPHLEEWLHKYNLAFSQVLLMEDKSRVFKLPVKYVIDDSPFVIQQALNVGIEVLSLRYPWNAIKGKSIGVTFFDNLEGILNYVKNA